MNRNQHHSPCKNCPFARTVEAGKTGGSDPAVFVGQSCGPFLLSCHMDPLYDPQEPGLEQLQCAGAAIYRANVNRDLYQPRSILKLPADKDKVFSSPAQLIAHHRKITLAEAEEWLKANTTYDLLKIEFDKQKCRLLGGNVPEGHPTLKAGLIVASHLMVMIREHFLDIEQAMCRVAESRNGG